ncbi:CaiB/BaiF CoA transferase family protein [Halobellus rubicundus]|uniref:CaiB/BaiF CoA transferase family protein n=1 Tax=Halobellus rubicundus TaxID=2996466 RepID=A0ABD5MJZ8_9EURY
MRTDDSLLTDVTVLDLGQAIAAPSAAGLLADFGADVVSVEPPGGSSQREFAKGSPLPNFDRNKRSIALDLKTERGTEALYRLVEAADVVIHNNRPGKMQELGCDYDTLSEINPRLIYCSLTGYGESGPYKDRPGFDPLAQAVSGLMSMTGEPDRKPSRIGASTIDIGTGIYAAYAIMMCLYKRKETGRGQRIETSLIDTAAMFMSQWYTYVSMGEQPPQRQGHTWDAYAPAGVFETHTDPIYMSVPFQHLWERLCKAVDRPDWVADPRFETKESRLRNREALHSELDEEFKSYSRSELMDLLLDANVPIAEVNTVEQALHDQHLQERGTIQTIENPNGDEVKAVSPPIRLSEAPATQSSAPPQLGENSREVLRECGYNEDDIESLLAEGVIQIPQ